MSMVNMKALLPITLNSTSGHTCFIPANEVTPVPQALVAEAMQRGAAPVDAAGMPTTEAAVGVMRLAITGELKKSMIARAIQQIFKSNRTSDFDSGGRPKTNAIAKLVDFDVFDRERDEILMAVKQSIADGVPLKEHPATDLAFSILDAASRKELEPLAGDAKFEYGQIKNMTMAEMKMALIQHLCNKVD